MFEKVLFEKEMINDKLFRSLQTIITIEFRGQKKKQWFNMTGSVNSKCSLKYLRGMIYQFHVTVIEDLTAVRHL
jgi:hypothetical protein